MHRLSMEIISPVQESVYDLKKQTKDFYHQYFDLVRLRSENDVLIHELALLREALLSFEEIKRENFRLKKALAYKAPITYQKVFAKVISWDSFKDFRMIRIDQGKKAGLQFQDIVVTPKGIVGSVYSSSENYSDVLLIADVNSRLDVINERTRTRGIVEGVSESGLRLKYGEKTEEYKEGDLLITAGLSFIPKGISVGRVVEVLRDDWRTESKVRVSPSVDLYSLEDVVVWTREEGR